MLLEIMDDVAIAFVVLTCVTNFIVHIGAASFIAQHKRKKGRLIYYADIRSLSNIANSNSDRIEIVEDAMCWKRLIVGSYIALVMATSIVMFA